MLQHIGLGQTIRAVISLSIVLPFVTPTILRAADTPAGKGPDGQWVNLSDAIVQKENDGKKEVWPGGTAGVICDPANGDVYMIVTGYGVWKSSDHGKTF